MAGWPQRGHATVRTFSTFNWPPRGQRCCRRHALTLLWAFSRLKLLRGCWRAREDSHENHSSASRHLIRWPESGTQAGWIHPGRCGHVSRSRSSSWNGSCHPRYISSTSSRQWSLCSSSVVSWRLAQRSQSPIFPLAGCPSHCSRTSRLALHRSHSASLSV